MDFHSQSALYAAIVALAVSIAVLLRARRSRIQVLFALLAANVFLWRGVAFLASLTAEPIWGQIEVVLACLIPATALRFFLSFPEEAERRAPRTVFLVDMLSIGFATVAALTPLSASRVFGALLVLYVFAVLYLCSYLVYRHYRRRRRAQEAIRLKYLFSGSFIVTTLALLDHLPALGIDFPSLGNVAILVYLFLLYQTIIRQRLLDLNEFMGRALILGLLATILAGMYAVLVLWTREVAVAILNSIIASLLIIIVFDPLRTKVEEIAGSILFREQFELERHLSTLRREMANVIELGDLWRLILSTIEKSRRATHASIYVLAEDGTTHVLAGSFGPPPPERLEAAKERALVDRLRAHGEPILRENLQHELEDLETGPRRGDPQKIQRVRDLLATLETLCAAVVIPFRSGKTVLGFLCLQDDRLREAYTSVEIELLRDVAAQATITIENTKAYQRLKERDRLAAIGEMAAGLAHEIRNPLGAIKGAAQYLTVDPDQPGTEFLSIIVEEVNRLNRVVSQFLDYARPFKAQPVPVDVNDVLRKTLQLLSTNGAGPQVEIALELDPALPTMQGDPELLKQVFLNLALNAVEAMPKGGKLTIQTRQGNVPAGSSRDRGRLLEVVFTDTGEGIAQKDLNNLFIPFYTTKERGTGLGLAICQRIVEGHGGAVRVRSRKGRGTTFIVQLPLESQRGSEA
jgi:two-component system sensor histidine kinase HydH